MKYVSDKYSLADVAWDGIQKIRNKGVSFTSSLVYYSWDFEDNLYEMKQLKKVHEYYIRHPGDKNIVGVVFYSTVQRKWHSYVLSVKPGDKFNRFVFLARNDPRRVLDRYDDDEADRALAFHMVEKMMTDYMEHEKFLHRS